MIGAGDIRRRLCQSSSAKQGIKQVLKRDPEDPSAAALKEPLHDKVTNASFFLARQLTFLQNVYPD